ncbi:MAG: hypothetical protein H5T73_05750 [Actinobacteria bacterium]|nr:hypothetical protein [Actinomycetota bacterium]
MAVTEDTAPVPGADAARPPAVSPVVVTDNDITDNVCRPPVDVCPHAVARTGSRPVISTREAGGRRDFRGTALRVRVVGDPRREAREIRGDKKMVTGVKKEVSA